MNITQICIIRSYCPAQNSVGIYILYIFCHFKYIPTIRILFAIFKDICTFYLARIGFAKMSWEINEWLFHQHIKWELNSNHARESQNINYLFYKKIVPVKQSLNSSRPSPHSCLVHIIQFYTSLHITPIDLKLWHGIITILI